MSLFIEERLALLEAKVADLERRLAEVEGRPAEPQPELPEWLSIAEAADLLGKHRNTIAGWIRNGRLPSERVGREVRVRRNDLMQVVKGDD